MVWCSEIEAHTGFVLDSVISVELGSVVGGDCPESVPIAFDERNDLSIELSGGARAELSDDDVLRFTLDQGDDAVTVVSAHDGIGFPMAEAGAVVGPRGTLGDMALVGEDPPGIGGSVAFSALFCGVAQVGVEVPTIAAVVPDMTVDGLVADVEDAVQAQPA